MGAAEAMTAGGPEGMGAVAEVSDTDAVRPDAAGDKALVDQVLADLKANFEKWEEVLAAQESLTYTAEWATSMQCVIRMGASPGCRWPRM